MAGAAEPKANGQRIVLLGAPGSGKGTQAAILAERLNIPAISTGEMLRAAVTSGTKLGQRVAHVMEVGDLVDDQLMAEVIEDRLSQVDATNGFLLDGYPRTGAQVETLDGILAGQGAGLTHVLFIDVPTEELIERALLRQRDDDREEIVAQRIRVYTEKTAPLIEVYRRRGLLREVDGNRPIEAVSHELAQMVGS